MQVGCEGAALPALEDVLPAHSNPTHPTHGRLRMVLTIECLPPACLPRKGASRVFAEAFPGCLPRSPLRPSLESLLTADTQNKNKVLSPLAVLRVWEEWQPISVSRLRLSLGSRQPGAGVV